MIPILLAGTLAVADPSFAATGGGLVGAMQACLIVDPAASRATLDDLEKAAYRMLRTIEPQGSVAVLAFLNAASSTYAQWLVDHKAASCHDLEVVAHNIAIGK